MASNKQEWIDAFKHLRLHFSLLLMPVFLFALSQVRLHPLDDSDYTLYFTSILVFIVLHLLVYPASNIYNGFNDKDIGSVGGLKNPPPSNKKMLWLANIFDTLALALSLLLRMEFTLLLFTYILASRLYSYRKIRLKQYPITGFIVIFIFQGAITYYMSLTGILIKPGCLGPHPPDFLSKFALLPMLATSFQIGAIYPLTQIYQHESDLADGVTTLSYKLGYRGTFIFAGIMFSIATLFYYLTFLITDINSFYLFTTVQIPIIGYFVYWARKVWQDTKYADYKHTMYMNVIAAVILNLFFLYLVVK
jgi:1,4-dihydroxy-2-naphthoate octaprenyltransferase